jgi:hypothetical protein
MRRFGAPRDGLAPRSTRLHSSCASPWTLPDFLSPEARRTSFTRFFPVQREWRVLSEGARNRAGFVAGSEGKWSITSEQTAFLWAVCDGGSVSREPSEGSSAVGPRGTGTRPDGTRLPSRPGQGSSRYSPRGAGLSVSGPATGRGHSGGKYLCRAPVAGKGVERIHPPCPTRKNGGCPDPSQPRAGPAAKPPRDRQRGKAPPAPAGASGSACQTSGRNPW